MTPLMLRNLWSIVEATQSHFLLNLDDPSLVRWLVKQLYHQRFMNHAEENALVDYIQSKLPLIRELAEQRV